MHISISAETLFHFLGFPITNSLIATWVTILILTTLAILVNLGIKLSPNSFQNFVEGIIEILLDLVTQVAGKKGRRFFPLVATFFLFILTANWLGLLPGFGSLGFYKLEEGTKVFIPLFRGATADLNTTLALALISVGAIQYFGLSTLRLPYLRRFFNFKSPIDAFVGILELISDFAKIISFAFRLFGNIFAGEVLLVVMSFLIPVLAPLPFYGLELFVGFIQALVFAMLTLVFLNVATVEHEGGE